MGLIVSINKDNIRVTDANDAIDVINTIDSDTVSLHSRTSTASYFSDEIELQTIAIISDDRSDSRASSDATSRASSASASEAASEAASDVSDNFLELVETIMEGLLENIETSARIESVELSEMDANADSANVDSTVAPIETVAKAANVDSTVAPIETAAKAANADSVEIQNVISEAVENIPVAVIAESILENIPIVADLVSTVEKFGTVIAVDAPEVPLRQISPKKRTGSSSVLDFDYELVYDDDYVDEVIKYIRTTYANTQFEQVAVVLFETKPTRPYVMCKCVAKNNKGTITMFELSDHETYLEINYGYGPVLHKTKEITIQGIRVIFALEDGRFLKAQRNGDEIYFTIETAK